VRTGHHLTSREVTRLMVNLLFELDAKTLTEPGIVRILYNPACGIGGMRSASGGTYAN
jgi:type I restriction enzyme M protein